MKQHAEGWIADTTKGPHCFLSMASLVQQVRVAANHEHAKACWLIPWGSIGTCMQDNITYTWQPCNILHELVVPLEAGGGILLDGWHIERPAGGRSRLRYASACCLPRPCCGCPRPSRADLQDSMQTCWLSARRPEPSRKKCMVVPLEDHSKYHSAAIDELCAELLDGTHRPQRPAGCRRNGL